MFRDLLPFYLIRNKRIQGLISFRYNIIEVSRHSQIVVDIWLLGKKRKVIWFEEGEVYLNNTSLVIIVSNIINILKLKC